MTTLWAFSLRDVSRCVSAQSVYEQGACMADTNSASASTSEQLRNYDILNYLKGLGGHIDSVEKLIESIDNRVSNFDKEVKR